MKISEIRNAFSRDADLPAFFRYAFSFAPYLTALPAILLFIRHKRRVLAMVLFCWYALYSISSTAQWLLIAGIVILVLGFSQIADTAALRRRILRFSMIACLAGLFTISMVSAFLTNDGILDNLPTRIQTARDTPIPEDKTPFAYSLGDFMRTTEHDQANPLSPKVFRKMDYLLYRIIFTPMEVSARWYEYFHYHPVEEQKIDRLITDSRTGERIHPTNAVGIWAYTERFPDKYLHEAYAYASIDADAHARFGFRGLAIVLMIFMLLRITLAAFDDRHQFTCGIFYASAISLLALLLAAASIQAILIAYGLVTLPLILAAIRILDKRVRL